MVEVEVDPGVMSTIDGVESNRLWRVWGAAFSRGRSCRRLGGRASSRYGMLRITMIVDCQCNGQRLMMIDIMTLVLSLTPYSEAEHLFLHLFTVDFLNIAVTSPAIFVSAV